MTPPWSAVSILVAIGAKIFEIIVSSAVSLTPPTIGQMCHRQLSPAKSSLIYTAHHKIGPYLRVFEYTVYSHKELNPGSGGADLIV
jgi:hypothetical protein